MPRMSKERRAAVVADLRILAARSLNAGTLHAAANELEAAWESEERLAKEVQRISADLERVAINRAELVMEVVAAVAERDEARAALVAHEEHP